MSDEKMPHAWTTLDGIEMRVMRVAWSGRWEAFAKIGAAFVRQGHGDEDYAAEIARLAARVAYLEQENARLTSDLIRSEGERERLMRQDRVLPPGKAR